MSGQRPMVFTAPVLATPLQFSANMGFIEGCSGGNKGPVSGCDVFTPPDDSCSTGFGIIGVVVGGVIGGIFTVAIAS